MVIYTEATLAQAVAAEYAFPTDLTAVIRAGQADLETPLETQMLKQAVRPEILPAQPDTLAETSLTQFCEFVDVFTRQAKQPLALALACEQQAELLRLAESDATPENLYLLVNTLLDAVERLEKKWLDAQIHGEEWRQRAVQRIAPPRPAFPRIQAAWHWLLTIGQRLTTAPHKPTTHRTPAPRKPAPARKGPTLRKPTIINPHVTTY